MGKIKTWLDNARFVATMQSLLPALLAAVLAIGQPGFKWYLAVLAVLGVNLAHCAMNLVDDLFDYKVDMFDDRLKVVRRGFKAYTAKYPYLTDGSATLSDLKKAIAAMGGLAVAFGLVIFIARSLSAGFGGPEGSWWIVFCAGLAAFLGWFYSAPPLRLSFHGLGELDVAVIFGPLLMVGVYYSAGGSVDPLIWILSSVVGLQVMNILFTHSIIDSAGDEESDKKTMAAVFHNDRLNMAFSILLNFVPYVIIALAVAFGALHWAYLSVLLMIPRSIWLYWSLVKFMRGEQIDEVNHPWYLGQMQYWDKVVEAGLNWYLIRWYTARNIVTGCSLIMAAVKILLTIIG